MIYKTRNRSNDTAESQKEKKARFNAHFLYSQSKITELNKMWSLKRLAMLKRESRASQHVVKFKWSTRLCSDVLLLFYEWLA